MKRQHPPHSLLSYQFTKTDELAFQTDESICTPWDSSDSDDGEVPEPLTDIYQ